MADRRTKTAAALAPICATLTMLAMGWLFYLAHGTVLGVEDMAVPFMTFLLITGAVSLCFSLPFHVLATRLRWNSAPPYCIFGIVLGFVLESASLFWLGAKHTRQLPPGAQLSHLLEGLVWFGGLIAVTVAFFWLIRRPDLDQQEQHV